MHWYPGLHFPARFADTEVGLIFAAEDVVALLSRMEYFIRGTGRKEPRGKGGKVTGDRYGAR